MRSRTLREAAEAADAERFVGRDAEVAVVRDLLAPESTHRILFVHGPGGIGKSGLLRAAVREARGSGCAVTHVDARSLPVDPERALGELVGQRQARPCLVIDEVDVLGSALDPLRDRLLETLPDDARIILAGRRGPGPTWREGGLDALVVDLPLGPLSDEAAGRILTARSLTRDRIDSVVAWAQGSPLALTVATSAPKGQLHEPGSTALEQRLTAWLAGHPFLDVSQEVIEVAALARSVDARLLAAALPGRNTREAFARLVALPVSEQIGDTVALHAVLAAAVRARVRATEPARAAAVFRRVVEHLATRARLGDMGALLRLSRLLEDPGLRAAIGNDPSATCHPDAMRPGELVDFARRHGFDAGPDWPEIRDWFERFPDQTLLMRRIEGHAVMVSSFVPVSQLASTGAVSESLLEAAKETDADPDRSFLGVVMFADVAPSDIADAARLGAGAFMLQRGVGDMQSMLIHYPSPDRRPTVQTAIATEVDGDLARGVAISDFRPDGAIGTVEAMVLGEHGLTRSSSGRAELLVQDDDVHRIARLREVLDEVFDDSDTDRRLRETIELVHLGGRRSEQECLEAMHVSRRTWFRLLRTARERVAAG